MDVGCIKHYVYGSHKNRLLKDEHRAAILCIRLDGPKDGPGCIRRRTEKYEHKIDNHYRIFVYLRIL